MVELLVQNVESETPFVNQTNGPIGWRVNDDEAGLSAILRVWPGRFGPVPG
jgi:hypothetical protein